MNIYGFIYKYNLRPADAVVLRKKFLGMVDHFAIFLGYRDNQPIFLANYWGGVKEIPQHELSVFLHTLEPTEIQKFPGREDQRKYAIRRAISRVGEEAYNFFSNNCEHFKNWVHYGSNYSGQVDKAGSVAIGLGIGAGLLALFSDNPKAGNAAVGLLVTGTLLKANSGE